MKIINVMKTFCGIFVLSLLVFLIFKTKLINYKVIKQIETHNVYGTNKGDIESIIIECLNKTTKDLRFKLKSNSFNVENTKIGNCVGYTKYFNKLFISKLKEKKYGNIIVTHARVKILIIGTNIHFINLNSLKDHDISIIHNKTNNRIYFVDSSLSEVFGSIVVKR